MRQIAEADASPSGGTARQRVVTGGTCARSDCDRVSRSAGGGNTDERPFAAAPLPELSSEGKSDEDSPRMMATTSWLPSCCAFFRRSWLDFPIASHCAFTSGAWQLTLGLAAGVKVLCSP